MFEKASSISGRIIKNQKNEWVCVCVSLSSLSVAGIQHKHKEEEDRW